MQDLWGDFFVSPPILSHLVAASSNHHDWLTSWPIPFWDLQLSLPWPLPPTLPRTLPSRECSLHAGQELLLQGQCGSCSCYLSTSKSLQVVRFSHWFIHPHIRQPHIPPTCTKKVSPPAWSKVDLLKARPNDVCHGRGAKCHRHMWGWLQEVVHSCRGPQDLERWVLGTQLGHRGREFPEAIVWGYSAEAPSWPGHANLGIQWNVGLMGVVLSVFFKTVLTLCFRHFRAKQTNKRRRGW